jgi:hypothetical protein
LTSGSAELIEKKQITIIDTGISTTGALDFSASTLWEYGHYKIGGNPRGDSESLKKIVTKIIYDNGNDAFPKLDGIDVLIIGKDDCFAAEADYLGLTTDDRRFIKAVWKTILEERCHAKVIFKTVTGWQRGIDYKHIEGSPNSYPFVSKINYPR